MTLTEDELEIVKRLCFMTMAKAEKGEYIPGHEGFWADHSCTLACTDRCLVKGARAIHAKLDRPEPEPEATPS